MTRHFLQGRGGGTRRPRRPSARAFRLWGREHQAGTGARFWPPPHPRSHSVLWVWQSSWQGHYGPLAKARLLGAEGRERGAWEGGWAGLLSCHSPPSRWSARAGGAGWWEGKGRRRFPATDGPGWAGAFRPEDGRGLAICTWRQAESSSPHPPPPTSAEKRAGKGRAAFIPSEVSNTLPAPSPTHRRDGATENFENAAGGGLRAAKVRAASTNHRPSPFIGQIPGRPEAEVRGSTSR